MTTAEQLHNESRNPSQGVRVNGSALPVVDGEVTAKGLGEGSDPVTSPTDYMAGISLALAVEDAQNPRALQSEHGIFGASDAGQCERRAVWTITQQPHTDVPKSGNAQSGTMLHLGVLGAVKALYPERHIEEELQVTLPSGIKLTLHPDEVRPDEPSVTDLKTTKEWAIRAKTGATDPQRMQVNLQYYAALQNGLITSDRGITRILFMNPADLDEMSVWQDTFDMEWVHRADDWFQGVIYAVEHGEDGEQQWPYNKCVRWCPFFSRCRPPEPELNQEITSPDLRELVLLGYEARANKKDWEQVDKHVTSEIKGLSGKVGTLQVVSTTVNGANGPYQKVEFRGEPS